MSERPSYLRTVLAQLTKSANVADIYDTLGVTSAQDTPHYFMTPGSPGAVVQNAELLRKRDETLASPLTGSPALSLALGGATGAVAGDAGRRLINKVAPSALSPRLAAGWANSPLLRKSVGALSIGSGALAGAHHLMSSNRNKTDVARTLSNPDALARALEQIRQERELVSSY